MLSLSENINNAYHTQYISISRESRRRSRSRSPVKKHYSDDKYVSKYRDDKYDKYSYSDKYSTDSYKKEKKYKEKSKDLYLLKVPKFI